MGQVGCDVVRQEADIVLLDDDFNSIFNAVRWGRNVFDNVRKFLQFQLTVNVSCLWIVILGGASLGMSPFSILQLLWINLIMDILAAIAMASEAPIPGELRAERVNLKEDPLISRSMWSAIYSQLIYQVLVMTTLLYAAPAMFGIEYNLVETPLYLSSAEGVEGGATYRLQHYTFLFQTFMLMNLFNMINCRVLPTEQDPQFNIVKNIQGNWWFVIVLLFEFNVQYLLVGYTGLGYVFTTTPLTLAMHLTAFGLGLGSLAVGALAKLLPPTWTDALPKVRDENDSAL